MDINNSNFENNNEYESEITVEENQVAEEGGEKVNWVKEIRDWVFAIVIALLIAFVIREYVFTLVKVQGESMEPSLQHNDRLYVNRFMDVPEKGDVVIFTPATDPNRPYIKRVIATEGDTIYIDIVTGNVYLNDEVLEEDYIKEKSRKTGTYIDGLIKKGEYSRENPIVIQPGYIFVMGDNRNNSKDSRHLGPVPIDEIMGDAVFRFWPFDNFGSVYEEITTDSETGLN